MILKMRSRRNSPRYLKRKRSLKRLRVSRSQSVVSCRLMVASQRVLLCLKDWKRRRRPRLRVRQCQSKILQVSYRPLLKPVGSQNNSQAAKLKSWRVRNLIRNLPTLVLMLTSERSYLKMAATCHKKVRLRSPKFRKFSSKLKPYLPLKKRESMRIPILLKLRNRWRSTFRKARRSRLSLMLL